MKRGFTLLEILLVIAAIAVLASIVIIALNPTRQLNQARDARQLSQLDSIKNALEQYLIDNGRYPLGITETQQEVCRFSGGISCLDITNDLTPLYLSEIPSSPDAVGDGSGYYVFLDNSRGAAHVVPEDIYTLSCPNGYIKVPGNPMYQTEEFCVMQFEAKQSGSDAVSEANGTPWVNILHAEAVTNCQNSEADLITNSQWMTIARNLEGQAENWRGGVVGVDTLYRGHTDDNPPNALDSDGTDGYFGTGNGSGSDQKRNLVLSNGEEIWDFSGNVWEWVDTALLWNEKPDGRNFAFEQWPNVVDYGNQTYDTLKPSNSSWDSLYGVGQYLEGSRNIGVEYYFVRSGRWNTSDGAGIFALYLDDSAASSSNIGFRCAISR